MEAQAACCLFWCYNARIVLLQFLQYLAPHDTTTRAAAPTLHPARSSFAVELGKAFFSSEAAKQQDADGGTAAAGGSASSGSGGEPLPIQPGNMVWLIQRDFLQVRHNGRLALS